MRHAAYDSLTNVVKIQELTLGPRGLMTGEQIAGAINELLDFLSAGATVRVCPIFWVVTELNVGSVDLAFDAAARCTFIDDMIEAGKDVQGILVGTRAVPEFVQKLQANLSDERRGTLSIADLRSLVSLYRHPKRTLPIFMLGDHDLVQLVGWGALDE